jgi:hypothetical protein
MTEGNNSQRICFLFPVKNNADFFANFVFANQVIKKTMKHLHTPKAVNLHTYFLLPFFIFTLIIPASAWDVTGHRVIADIAYKNLSCKARRGVDKILGKKGIIFESSWADGVRNEKGYEYSYPWHYQNLKDSMNADDLKNLLANPQNEGDHLFYAIKLMTERLKKNKKDAEALKFLVHFVGDLHQPMHLGRATDRGGNSVMLTWFGSQVNLHALWDSYLIDRQKLSYTEMSEMLQKKYYAERKKFKNASIESSVMAVYDLRTQLYATDMNVTKNYLYAYIFTAQHNEMLYRAGMQLARILNEIY